ncbi:DUF6311 domain-containing protein [Falsiroseomonas oryziterrae]|uniref:DUF6311 domain-containing protein n=1 Tax=Falsiroseomonas oryziterrae TaxID=2911368 RepID=UPI001F18DC9C|nr:DUF6311 domain-containing protein [Roseomonas sp. NPKOSM-4]
MTSPTGRVWIGRLGLLIACLIGVIPVLLMFGPGVVLPSHVGWILGNPLSDDPGAHLLGWHYFRTTPFEWPPSRNSAYGLELGSSIFYSDSIPLLALGLKAIGAGPLVEQYWGAWLIATSMLQAAVAWAVTGLATRDVVARAALAGLAAWQPILIWRMAIHPSLAGQFLICAALLLYFRGRTGRGHAIGWCLLLFLSSLVHSYLLVMVGAIWFADWLRRLEQRRPPGLVEEAVAAFGSTLLGLWLAGFFVLTDGHVSGGYGDWSLDLAAFFDGGTWSAFLPDLPDNGEFEVAASYLGLGTLGLLAIGFAVGLRTGCLRRAMREHGPLLRIFLLLALFAITHRVFLAGREIIALPLPALIEEGFGMLRASNRMVWPLVYASIFAAGFAVIRRAGRLAGPMLAALLALQVADVAPGILERRQAFAGVPPTLPAVAQNPFWPEAATRYTRLRAVPTAVLAPGWLRTARLASELNLPTDAVYIARVDVRAWDTLRDRTEEAIRTGRHEPGTLYILRTPEIRQLAEAAMDPQRDLLAEVDGFTVLAPGWFVTPAAAPAP